MLSLSHTCAKYTDMYDTTLPPTKESSQTGSGWFKLVQTALEWFTLIQTGSDWLKLEQTGLQWYRPDQTSFKLVQNDLH